MIGPTTEIDLIEKLVLGFRRSPRQCNALQESDAELVRLPSGSLLLAITTDAIHEEIARGLYADPFQIGWMAVAVNASDLAAVGADPLGIVLSEALPPELPDGFLASLQRGIADAADAFALPVLGGDTNAADRLSICGTAVGLVPARSRLLRSGMRPGDAVFSSGPLGLGSAWAAAVLAGAGGIAPSFQPQPRIRHGRLLRRCASACTDSSDGLLAALDQLVRAGGCGIDITAEMHAYMHPFVWTAADAFGVSPWMFLAGPHGEFELVFAVPQDRVDALLAAAAGIGWHPQRLGRAVAEPGVTLALDGRPVRIDTAAIRSLAHAFTTPADFIADLTHIEHFWMAEA